MQETIISNKKALNNFKDNLAKEGIEGLLVLADFDRTFTYGWVNGATACPLTGKRAPSLTLILRDEPGYLSPDYAHKAKVLHDKYEPLEKDFSLSRKVRLQAMLEWWEKHFELLINSGLEKQDIEKAVTSPNLVLRQGAKKFLSFLKENNIPLIFISASGLGIESIKIFLEKRGLYSQNIYIVSNNFVWNKQGKAIAYKEPIVHTLNKGEVNLRHFALDKIAQQRKTILLLGDSVDDIDMARPFKPKTLLKVGFLDFDINKRLSAYKTAFDVVLLNNSPFDFINKTIMGYKQ